MNLALEVSHRRLQELDRAKSDFLLNVSHELRTPLTAIKGSVDNMLDEITGPISEPQRRYLQRVKANADQLVRLINDLLDLARIEEGRVQIASTFFSVTGLAGELVETLRPMATEKDLRLQLTETEDPLMVYADRDKIGQVLMNLIGNAIKFTPSGGQITVTARRVTSGECRVSSSGPDIPANGEQVEIAIADSGEGIPAEELPYIFDKFYQVQLGIQAKAKGTGLGLAIAKSLVELQGGSIWVQSQVGEGSTFVFTLPHYPVAEIDGATTPGSTEKTL
jgi:signal transduction histidine kinase